MDNRIPEYFVSTGISGDPVHYTTYVRKPNGSLRRIHSRRLGVEQLPDRSTRREALVDLLHWLWQRQSWSTPGTGYAEYGRQANRVAAEIEAEKGASQCVTASG